MQSTARFVAPKEMSTNVQFLLDCLNENGISESFESQTETAPRVAELSSFTIMQQSRRMLQRPLSIAGVEVADVNRFFVNLGSQAETCARPLVISDAMFKSIQSPIQAINTTQPTTEEGKMPTAAIETIATPHAWDFRSKNHGSDFGVDRRWDWPALDEASVRIPAPMSAIVWSKEPSRTRIPSMKKRSAAADAESLRKLLNTAMTRETQRIETRTTNACPVVKHESLAKKLFDSVVSATRSLKTKFKAA